MVKEKLKKLRKAERALYRLQRAESREEHQKASRLFAEAFQMCMDLIEGPKKPFHLILPSPFGCFALTEIMIPEAYDSRCLDPKAEILKLKKEVLVSPAVSYEELGVILKKAVKTVYSLKTDMPRKQEAASTVRILMDLLTDVE